MINVAHARSAVAQLPGDTVALPKSQYAEMLAEIEIGQQARRALTSIRTVTAIAASHVGAPA